jgi:putative peptidoglycan lipid II flippase
LPALAPVALNIGYIIGLVFFVPILGIYGLAWGLVLGGFLHILIQVPGLIRFNFRYLPILDRKMAGVKEIVRLMIPRLVTLGSVQAADLVVIRLTSALTVGSTSSYFYGYYLMQLPETLFGTAIAIVVFPTMSELYNAGDIKGLKETSMTALRIIWLFTIPSAVGLILLGRTGIGLFFQGGAFTSTSTDLVYGVLVFFSLRIVSEASLEILARLFYAQHDTRTPMYVALGWLVVNVILALLLVGRLGVRGLALSSTVAFTIQSIILFLISRHRLGDMGELELAKSGARFIVAATGMTIVIVVLGQIVSNPLLWLFFSVIAGLVTYFGLTYLLGSPEITSLLVLIRTRSTQSTSSAP